MARGLLEESREESFGPLVDGDGVAGCFEEGAGFVLFDLHLAEHGLGLLEGVEGLGVGVLAEGEIDGVSVGFGGDFF